MKTTIRYYNVVVFIGNNAQRASVQDQRVESKVFYVIAVSRTSSLLSCYIRVHDGLSIQILFAFRHEDRLPTAEWVIG